MELSIRPALAADVDTLAGLYAAVTAALTPENNFCGWNAAGYPTRRTAEEAIRMGGAFLAEADGACVGSVRLVHQQEPAYAGAPWAIDAPESEVLTVLTLAVHPGWRRQGIAQALLANADLVAAQQHCQDIRLDVYEKNEPAIRLYESFGYRYVSTVDLGLEAQGIPLKWFRLYERPVLAAAKRLFC